MRAINREVQRRCARRSHPVVPARPINARQCSAPHAHPASHPPGWRAGGQNRTLLFWYCFPCSRMQRFNVRVSSIVQDAGPTQRDMHFLGIPAPSLIPLSPSISQTRPACRCPSIPAKAGLASRQRGTCLFAEKCLRTAHSGTKVQEQSGVDSGRGPASGRTTSLLIRDGLNPP